MNLPGAALQPGKKDLCNKFAISFRLPIEFYTKLWCFDDFEYRIQMQLRNGPVTDESELQ